MKRKPMRDLRPPVPVPPPEGRVARSPRHVPRTKSDRCRRYARNFWIAAAVVAVLGVVDYFFRYSNCTDSYWTSAGIDQCMESANTTLGWVLFGVFSLSALALQVIAGVLEGE